jgi:oxygen-independent coproporphyrinogen III oxidase
MILPLPMTAEAEEQTPEANPYVSYAYSYPHKSAYGKLVPPIPLAPLWSTQQKGSLFLYFHIPFCAMRCGFCNLFARAGGDTQYVDAYLDALERQARVVAAATAGGRTISRLALGGGTPTYLSVAQLHRVFDFADRFFDANPRRIPASVEVSPETATADRVGCLHERGVERVSIGVQSFFDDDNRAVGRPQKAAEVLAALDRLRAFRILNIDLIYGQPGQTVAHWLDSVRIALRHEPDELYLYPLYVRPETGIGRRGQTERLPPARMRECYAAARDLLLDAGFEQVSMRFFRLRTTPAAAGPVYCCQTDGMLGLGCGARSYTSHVHYSSPFAVEASGVHSILDAWMQQSDAEFASAHWGCKLTEDDRRRRFLMQSVLALPGFVEEEFVRIFGAISCELRAQLAKLMQTGYVENKGGRWRLTPLGFEFSDAIGPALYAPTRLAQFEEFAQS